MDLFEAWMTPRRARAPEPYDWSPLNLGDKPMIVVDRSVMLGPTAKVLPRNASIVLPDIYFYEMSTADEDKRARDRACFEPMIRKHQSDRLLIARHWRELSRAEWEIDGPIDRRESVSIEASNALLSVLLNEGLNWSVSEADESTQQWRDEANEFLTKVRMRSSFLREQSPDALSRLVDDDELTSVVCQPAFIASWLGQNMPHYAMGEWPSRLTRYPDIYAAARWGRLLVWYTLRFAARGGSDKDVGNSYYDAKYLFSASYVGRLATLDHDQAIACRAVFPYVAVFGDRAM